MLMKRRGSGRLSAARLRRVSLLLLVLIWTCTALTVVSAQTNSDGTQIKTDPEAAANYKLLSGQVSPSNLAQTVDALSAIHYNIPQLPGAPAGVAYSRMAGTPGGDQALGYVRSQFQNIFGAQNVTEEPFSVTIPVDHGAFIRDSSRSYLLRPMWPNLVRTSTLPEHGIDGPLIYAGHGDVREYRGKQVEGSVVLLDFNCGTQWLNAPRLGAKAVIFIEPTEAQRGEAESKFIGIPVSIPRFWISRAEAAALQTAALTIPNYQVHVECYQPWERHNTSNLIGVIPGTDPVLSKQIVVVESYYDSMSVVPSLAPGAESACGMASLLELARIYKANPPKRTVWFVACGAHFLGLQGARTYVDKHLEQWQDSSGWDGFLHAVSFGHVALPTGRQDVRLFTGLDLSSGSSGVGVFYKGYFYNYREDINGDFSDIGRTMRENAAKIGQVLGFDSDQQFADGINGVNGKTWRNYLPGHFAFDAEVATLAGGKGVTLGTINDGRPHCDTPSDTADLVNIANLEQQTRVLACQYWDMFNDTDNPDSLPQDSSKGVMPVPTWPAWTREGLRLGMTELTGRVLQFDPIKNFVPDKPIVDSLAVIVNPSKTMVSVRGNLITQVYSTTDKPDSQYEFVGLPLITAQPQGLINTVDQTTGLQAFHLLDNTGPRGSRGDIDYAPDQQSAYNVPITLTSTIKDTQIIVFPCVETAIYDLIDQQALKTLDGVNILDGASNSNPREYGFLLAQAEPGVSYAEDVAVLFSTPGKDTRLKVLMSSGPDVRFLLINSLPIDPKASNAENQRNAQGIGYAVGSVSALEANYTHPPNPNDPNDVVRAGTITDTDYRVARDMWNLDEFRIQQLAQFRIVDDNVHNAKGTGLHDLAAGYITRALAAYNARDYNAFDSYSREAWGFEARVYPQVQNTANDVIKGVVFYLFLLIPFAFFLERLLVGSSDLRGQLAWSFGIFVIVFLIFSSVHPAFKITVNPMMVLIAFVMLALSVFVSLLIWGKFEEQLHAISQTVTGVHKVEAGKASIAFAAFALGISNMRRRKERTILTCITLVLLTFTVLSFTSVVNQIRTNDVPAPGVSRYNGILIRLPNWDSLQEPAYRIVSDEYGRQYPVAPRAWYFGTDQGQQTFLSVSRAELSTDIKGDIGMTPQEADVTNIGSSLIAGRWLNPTDTYSVILPKPIADSLGIGLKDTGRTNVVFTGIQYLVVGIYDPDKFKAVTDLDDESLTPVDYQASAQMQSSSSGGGGGSSSSAGFQQFTHLDPSNVIITPYKTVMNMGGGLRSIAINFGTAAATDSELRNLIKRLDLNIYAGENGHNHRFSAIAGSKSNGLLDIVIPILIAALIVLNTMLGSVFERVKEIVIFSSIGLSPSNISMLFIAEALVYGIIGAVSGYLIGQTLSKVISSLNLLQGLYLNFSSTSAELSIFLVIAVVLLSTIYPARKASEVASPSVDRVWRLPDPVGDEWDITLPFAVTGQQATGVNNFLAEWFSSFEEQSVGDFLTNNIQTGPLETERGPGHVLTVRVWLAPFDLGVSQDIALKIVPTELDGVYSVELHIERVSGDVSNWKRINRRFLNVIRKQFLIWRTLNEMERQRYLAMEATPVVNEVPAAAAVQPAV